jgi:hypothetical protein
MLICQVTPLNPTRRASPNHPPDRTRCCACSLVSVPKCKCESEPRNFPLSIPQLPFIPTRTHATSRAQRRQRPPQKECEQHPLSYKVRTVEFCPLLLGNRRTARDAVDPKQNCVSQQRYSNTVPTTLFVMRLSAGSLDSVVAVRGRSNPKGLKLCGNAAAEETFDFVETEGWANSPRFDDRSSRLFRLSEPR